MILILTSEIMMFNIMILSWYDNNSTIFSENEELNWTGIDEDEIDSYILIPDTMMLNYEYHDIIMV